jgi:hypothetical protein
VAWQPQQRHFLLLQWVERLEKAGTWKDVQTMALVYLAFRQNDFVWWDSLSNSGVSTIIWEDFK